MSSLTITDFHHSLLKENKHQLFTNEKIVVLFLCWFESLEKEKEYYSLHEKFIPMKDLLKYIA